MTANVSNEINHGHKILYKERPSRKAVQISILNKNLVRAANLMTSMRKEEWDKKNIVEKGRDFVNDGKVAPYKVSSSHICRLLKIPNSPNEVTTKEISGLNSRVVEFIRYAVKKSKEKKSE